MSHLVSKLGFFLDNMSLFETFGRSLESFNLVDRPAVPKKKKRKKKNPYNKGSYIPCTVMATVGALCEVLPISYLGVL